MRPSILSLHPWWAAFATIPYGLLFISLFYGFDDFDEGYFLYILRDGPDGIFTNAFQIPLHYMGELFNHHLIGYRIISLCMVLMSCILTLISLYLVVLPSRNSTIIFAYIIFLSGILYYSVIQPIVSYNTESLLSLSFLLLFTTIYFKFPKLRFMIAILLPLFLLPAALSRPATYLGAFSVSIAVMMAAEWTSTNRRMSRVLVFIVSTTVVTLLTYLAFRQTIDRTAIMMAANSDSTHSISLLIHTNIYEAGKFLIVEAPAFLFLFLAIYFSSAYIARNENIKRIFPSNIREIMCVTLIFIITIIVIYRPRYLVVVSCSVAALHVLYYYHSKQLCRDKELVKVETANLIVCVSTFLLVGAGTNSSLMKLSTASSLFGGYVLGQFLYKYTREFTKYHIVTYTTCGLLLVAVSVSIVKVRFDRQVYSSVRFSAFDTVAPRSSYLFPIRIEAPFARALDELSQALAMVGYEPAKDRIFSTYNSGRIVGALPVTALGSPNNLPPRRRWPATWKFNCKALQVDSKNHIRNVFLLVAQSLDPKLFACLAEVVDLGDKSFPPDGNKFIRTISGFGYIPQLHLYGPFQLSGPK